MQDADDYARLFYLVLLGMFVASYFLYDQRQKMSQTLQQAAIWGVIFVFVIIGYGFKDVFMGQVFTSDPQSISENTLALTRARDGHYYANVEVNGTMIEFVVDTGASDIVLTREDAIRVGIEPTSLRFSGRAETANGTVPVAQVWLENVRLGKFSESNVPASVNGGPMFGSLLGMSFLQNYRIEIDGRQMLLSR